MAVHAAISNCKLQVVSATTTNAAMQQWAPNSRLDPVVRHPNSSLPQTPQTLLSTTTISKHLHSICDNADKTFARSAACVTACRRSGALPSSPQQRYHTAPASIIPLYPLDERPPRPRLANPHDKKHPLQYCFSTQPAPHHFLGRSAEAHFPSSCTSRPPHASEAHSATPCLALQHLLRAAIHPA